MNNRKRLIIWLFEKSQILYTKYFKKNKPWHINKSDLLLYPEGSFGKKLGEFLELHGFDIIPKAERHDAYHILTGYNTTVESEIAQQYLCFGNGKRSPYLFGVMILGTLILPEYIGFYIKSYHVGKTANVFHNLDFKNLLNTPFNDLQSCIFSKSHINKLIQSHHA